MKQLGTHRETLQV